MPWDVGRKSQPPLSQVGAMPVASAWLSHHDSPPSRGQGTRVGTLPAVKVVQSSHAPGTGEAATQQVRGH